MTSYSSEFTLTGDEVKVYRSMLTIWRDSLKARLEHIEPSDPHLVGAEAQLRTATELLKHTYLPAGMEANTVKEFMDLAIIQPFWQTMLSERLRVIGLWQAEQCVSFEQRNHTINYLNQIDRIESVINKLMSPPMRSELT